MNTTFENHTFKQVARFVLTPVMAAILAVPAMVILPSVAEAHYCGACVNETRRQHQHTRSHVTQKVDQATNTIVETFVRTTQDATAANTRQQAETATAQNEAAIERSRAEDKRAVERSIGDNPVGCDIAAAANGPRGGGVVSGGKRASGAGSGYAPHNSLDKYTKLALKTAGQTKDNVDLPENMLEQNQNLAVGGCTSFAEPGSERALLCSNAGLVENGAVASQLPNADIQATSLFDFLRKIMTLPRKGQARDGRNVYLMNVTKPIPLPRFKEETLRSPMGMQYMSIYNQYEAIKSLGEFPLREYDRLTSTLPSDDTAGRAALTATYTELMKSPSTNQFVTDYIKKVNDAQIDNDKLTFSDLSPLDLMNLEVERRIGNPDWVKEMVGLSHEERVREMMMMQAYQMRIDFAQLKATLTTNVLLGQIINSQADAVYRPRLEEFAEGLDSQRIVQDYTVTSSSASETP